MFIVSIKLCHRLLVLELNGCMIRNIMTGSIFAFNYPFMSDIRATTIISIYEFLPASMCFLRLCSLICDYCVVFGLFILFGDDVCCRARDVKTLSESYSAA